MQVTTNPLSDGGVTRGRHVCIYSTLNSIILCVCLVKEMTHTQKRRSSILETVVPRRFTTHLGSAGSPKSPRKLPQKAPVSSANSIPLLGASELPASQEGDASSKLQEKEEKLPHKEETPNVVDQNGEVRWSVSDLPSLQLHNQDLPSLVAMMEQVS